MTSSDQYKDYLDSLRIDELADLDDSEFINIVKFGDPKHIKLYASLNNMTLAHCAIVIYFREECYADFVEVIQLPLELIVKTMPRLSPAVCGKILPVYGLRDPGFAMTESYISHIGNLLGQDSTYEKISRSGAVSLDDISNNTAARCMESDKMMELMISSILENYE